MCSNRPHLCTTRMRFSLETITTIVINTSDSSSRIFDISQTKTDTEKNTKIKATKRYTTNQTSSQSIQTANCTPQIDTATSHWTATSVTSRFLHCHTDITRNSNIYSDLYCVHSIKSVTGKCQKIGRNVGFAERKLYNNERGSKSLSTPLPLYKGKLRCNVCIMKCGISDDSKSHLVSFLYFSSEKRNDSYRCMFFRI